MKKRLTKEERQAQSDQLRVSIINTRNRAIERSRAKASRTKYKPSPPVTLETLPKKHNSGIDYKQLLADRFWANFIELRNKAILKEGEAEAKEQLKAKNWTVPAINRNDSHNEARPLVQGFVMRLIGV